jgi:putative lipoic acid-binding regulatory protein
LKSRTITVELSMTINTGNYNSVKITIGATEPISIDQNRGDEIDSLYNDLEEQLREDLAIKFKKGMKDGKD